MTFGILLGAFGGGASPAPAERRLRACCPTETLVRATFVGFAICRPRRGAQLRDRRSPWRRWRRRRLLGAGAVDLQRAIQLSAPRWVVGRAIALYQMAAFGGMAGGSWVWGGLAERLGRRRALARSRPCARASGLRSDSAAPAESRGSSNLDPLGAGASRRWRWTSSRAAAPSS